MDMDTLNALADTWVRWMVPMFWQVALLAGLVWMLSRVFRRRSAAFRHMLWLVVFLKLVIPPTLAAPWSLGNAIATIPETPQSISFREGVFPTKETDSESLIPLMAGAPLPKEYNDLKRLSTPALAMIAWAAGATGLFGLMLVQYWWYRRRMLGNLSEAPDTMRELLERQAALLGLTRRVELKLSQKVSTPAVVGLVHPVILLPAAWDTEFPEADLINVLAHELAHIKRGDLLVGWITGLLACVYWFHPAAWVAGINLRREREMVCDDMVLKSERQENKEYSSTILRVAESFTGSVPAGAGLLGLMELSDNLLHRIRSAGDAARPRRLGLASGVCITLIAVLLIPMGVWSAPPQKNTANIEEEIEAHYKKADPEVKQFVRMTADRFKGYWLPENTFENLSSEEREAKVQECLETLKGDYGRGLCEALGEASVLKDKRLTPSVLRVATFRLGERIDNRARWIAVMALGKIGDKETVPVLVNLVDYYNKNVSMWAQAGLVRFTGQNFGNDKKAWANWWNESKNKPKIDVAALKPWPVPQPPQAPRIVSISPGIGATNVDPATTEIRVTFDQDMGGGFSWTGGGEKYPKTTGKPRWVDKRTCVLPVALERARFYRVGINSKSYKNFRSASGIPVKDTVLYFATEGVPASESAWMTAPTVVSMTPKNGAKVSPSLSELSVTFDQAMGAGFSWVRGIGNFPKLEGKPSWSEDKKTCSVAASLEPGTPYRFSLNREGYVNFQNSGGVPLKPVIWEFTTKEAE